MKKQFWLIVAGIMVLLAVIAYVSFGSYYSSRFLPGTNLYGNNVSQLNAAQATKKVEKAAQKKQFVFYDRKQKIGQVSAKQLGLTQKMSGLISQQLAHQNPWLFQKTSAVSEKATTVLTVANKRTATAFIQKMVTRLNQKRRVSKDAAIVNDANGFVVKKAVQGNQLSVKQASERLMLAVTRGNRQVDLTSAYLKPAITSSSPNIKVAIKKLKQLGHTTGVYQFDGKTISITSREIRSFLQYQQGQITVDDTKLTNYLSELNHKYATYDKSREFQSTKRGKVVVPAGIYGWSINISAEEVALKQAILSGKDFTRTPYIQGSGYHSDGTDIGNTYVEVDKTNQHMYVYLDGKLKLSTDVVTGKPKQATPSGVFYVWAKKRNESLKGTNDDGSKYDSKVSYWMPINTTGVGLHDSPWQPKYGGTWYLTHGSHGCVNTPPAVMKKLYSLVPEGTPVIVF